MLPQDGSNIGNGIIKIVEVLDDDHDLNTTQEREEVVQCQVEEYHVIESESPQEDDDVLSPHNDHISAVDTSTPNITKDLRKQHKGSVCLDEQGEYLEKMSVRGMDIQRYEHIIDGVTYCLVCAKNDIYKTFKNKYSFQRHAYLLHEGDNRKIFACTVCDREFSRPDKMKLHKRDKHGDMNAPLANGRTVVENNGNIPPPAKRARSSGGKPPRARKPRNSLANTSDIAIPSNDAIKKRLAQIDGVLDEVQNAASLECNALILPGGTQVALANDEVKSSNIEQGVINMQQSQVSMAATQSYSPITTTQIQPLQVLNANLGDRETLLTKTYSYPSHIKLENIPTVQQTTLGNLAYLPFTNSALPGQHFVDTVQSYQVLTSDALRSYQSAALKQKINEVGPYVMATSIPQSFSYQAQPPKSTNLTLLTTASIPNPTLIKVETGIPTPIQQQIIANNTICHTNHPQLQTYALQNVGHISPSAATPSNVLPNGIQTAVIKLEPNRLELSRYAITDPLLHLHQHQTANDT